ncbi:histone-lysine N-methyltransferase SETDB2 isoform X1 [Pelobates cultripes]|uniref:Histone-lysine N-methyltransferase SETDB2 isoform X1 n=1 Tax=Pelobates cultripes TaxID=61616 RepID=A0AAD1VRH8_PELCU|nr:histone-lysine N-methyltransferase SETDB2 isoform X1 [Pelobates cultripes]
MLVHYFSPNCNLFRSKCACLQLTAKAYHENAEMAKDAKTLGYKYKRLRSPLPTGLYECNLTCKCDPKMCQNRVVQHGIQVRLQVFKTKSKGWGVRCLDDVDSGTFVCTYAGRIFVRSFDTDSNKMAIGSTFDNDEGNQATAASSIPVNRKRHVSHSDSEIILMHSTPCTNPKSFSSSQTEIKRVKKDASKERLSDSVPIKRPKTRTAVLQKLRRQLIEEGSCILQHSSDDEDLVLQTAGKVIHTEESESDHVVRVAETTTNQSEKAVGYISDDSNTSILSDICPLETSSCEAKDESNKATVCLLASQPPFYEENEYYLDASKEGNVGRFLNEYKKILASHCPSVSACLEYMKNLKFQTAERILTNKRLESWRKERWSLSDEARRKSGGQNTSLKLHREVELRPSTLRNPGVKSKSLLVVPQSA